MFKSLFFKCIEKDSKYFQEAKTLLFMYYGIRKKLARSNVEKYFELTR